MNLPTPKLEPGLYYLKKKLPNPNAKLGLSGQKSFPTGFYLLQNIVLDAAKPGTNLLAIFRCDSRGNKTSDEYILEDNWPGAYDLLCHALVPVHSQSYTVKVEVTLTLTPAILGTTEADAANLADKVLRELLEGDLDRDNWAVKFSLLGRAKVKDAKGTIYRM